MLRFFSSAAFAGFITSMAALQAMAADGVETSLYPCVLMLAVPPFGPISYLGDTTIRPVVATATIGSGGLLSDVTFSEGSDRHHRSEINEYLTARV